MQEEPTIRRRRGKRYFAALLGLMLIIGAVGGYRWWSRPQFDLVRLPMSDDFRAWPLDRFWQWKVRLPAPYKGEYYQLRLHSRAEPLPTDGTSGGAFRGDKPTLSPKTSEMSADAGYFTDLPDQPPIREVNVAFQVIAFPPGTSSTQPADAAVRVLASISHGGVTSNVAPTDALPLQGTVESWETQSEKNWNGPSLLLARVVLRQEHQRRLYELVVVRHDPKRWPVMADQDQ